MQTVKLELTIDEINGILSMLGRLPFAEVNNTISLIVEAAQKQIAAEEQQEAKEQ